MTPLVEWAVMMAAFFVCLRVGIMLGRDEERERIRRIDVKRGGE